MFVEFLTVALLTGVKWYLVVLSICVSLIFSEVDIFSCDFFLQRCNINFPLEICFLKFFQLSNSFSMTSPWIFLEIECFSLVTPRALWTLSTHSAPFQAAVAQLLSHIISWICMCVNLFLLCQLVHLCELIEYSCQWYLRLFVFLSLTYFA